MRPHLHAPNVGAAAFRYPLRIESTRRDRSPRKLNLWRMILALRLEV